MQNSGGAVQTRDARIQTLEANGQLSNIRAQIRSSVFKIVDEPNTEKKVRMG